MCDGTEYLSDRLPLDRLELNLVPSVRHLPDTDVDTSVTISRLRWTASPRPSANACSSTRTATSQSTSHVLAQSAMPQTPWSIDQASTPGICEDAQVSKND
jgi:hypothetical protein